MQATDETFGQHHSQILPYFLIFLCITPDPLSEMLTVYLAQLIHMLYISAIAFTKMALLNLYLSTLSQELTSKKRYT